MAPKYISGCRLISVCYAAVETRNVDRQSTSGPLSSRGSPYSGGPGLPASAPRPNEEVRGRLSQDPVRRQQAARGQEQSPLDELQLEVGSRPIDESVDSSRLDDFPGVCFELGDTLVAISPGGPDGEN
jgi:hypothetical protein